MERVVACLHVGSCETILRRCGDLMSIGLRSTVVRRQSELVQLFPDIARKGLKQKMWYLDDLAGEVSNTDNLVLYS